MPNSSSTTPKIDSKNFHNHGKATVIDCLVNLLCEDFGDYIRGGV